MRYFTQDVLKCAFLNENFIIIIIIITITITITIIIIIISIIIIINGIYFILHPEGSSQL